MPAALATFGSAGAIRIGTGGAGLAPDLVSLGLNTLAGLVARHARGRRTIAPKTSALCVAGVLAINLVSYLSVPSEFRADIVLRTTLPLRTALTFSTLGIGTPLRREENRVRLMRENWLFHDIVNQLPYSLSATDLDGEELVANPAHGAPCRADRKIAGRATARSGSRR